MQLIQRVIGPALAGVVGLFWTVAIASAMSCSDGPPRVCTMSTEIEFNWLLIDQPLQFIDFETLPNGQPSVGGTQITPSFNYTHLGVTFTAPVGTPIIGGSGPGAYDLRVSVIDPLVRTWLRADFTNPSFGAGIYFHGATVVTAYDAHDAPIASMQYGFSGGPWFIGIYYEIPIAYVIADRGSNAAFIGDFIFSPIPEPATLALLALAATRFRRRR